jgi:hypothetical protein
VLAAHGWGGAAAFGCLAAGAGTAALTTRWTGHGIRTPAIWWAMIDAASAPLTLAVLGVFHVIAGLLGGVVK